MIQRLRRLALVAVVAGIVALGAACNNGGGTGATAAPGGGSAAPQSQAAPGY
jgi:hypothetical protein